VDEWLARSSPSACRGTTRGSRRRRESQIKRVQLRASKGRASTQAVFPVSATLLAVAAKHPPGGVRAGDSSPGGQPRVREEQRTEMARSMVWCGPPQSIVVRAGQALRGVSPYSSPPASNRSTTQDCWGCI
jgi:hypothetical protein